MKRTTLAICCVTYLMAGFANTEHVANQIDKKAVEQADKSSYPFNLQSIYSYRDFKFQSINLSSFNRFQGHTNLYLIGATNFQLTKKLSGGVFVYRTNTSLSSSTLLPQMPIVYTSQFIHNNNISAYLLNFFTTHLFVNLIAGYGKSKLQSSTVAESEDRLEQQFAPANSHSTNWFANVNAFYNTTWDNFSLTGLFGVLHARINQGGFTYLFQPSTLTNDIAPLSNKATYLLENAKISYKIKQEFEPFVRGGLIQVVQFTNSRPLITGVAVSSLPEFNLNQNGFYVGAGVHFKFKYVSLELEQQYLRRSNVYHSNISVATLSIPIG